MLGNGSRGRISIDLGDLIILLSSNHYFDLFRGRKRFVSEGDGGRVKTTCLPE